MQPLFFTLAALVIPAIIILYLLKRKYQDQTISSTLLWNQVLDQLEANRPWQKLWRHLLLWLQLLAAILMIFALTRPFIVTDGLKAPHTVLLIDVSGSMQTIEQDPKTRLDLAKEKALQFIDQMNAEQAMTLVALGEQPNVLVSQSTDQSLLKKKIKEMEGEYRESDLHGGLALSQALTSKHPSSEIILIGDGANVPAELTFRPHRFIQVGTHKENIAIGSFTVTEKGNKYDAFARLDHLGDKKSEVMVYLYNDKEQMLDTQLVQLAGRETKVVRWNQLPHSTYYRVSISSPNDHLALDNERFAFSNRNEQREAIVIGSENLFLFKALQLDERTQVTRAEQVPTKGNHEMSTLMIEGAQKQLPPSYPLVLLNPQLKEFQLTGKASISGNVQLDSTHPMMKEVPLKQMHALEVKKMKPPSWAKVIVRSGDVPLILAGEEQGRRVVIFTFDLQKSDLPLQPGFPILIQQMMSWLQPTTEHMGIHAEAGEVVQLPVSPGKGEIKLVHNDQSISYSTEGKNSSLTLPNQTGLFKVEEKEAMTGKNLWIASSFPLAESSIQPQSIPTRPLSDDSVPEKGITELWWWIAWLILIVVGLEWMVYRRGY
ncbi:VWA domain-containing protein [Hazenella coriacea]|nr:VWA domain-containing protein [Hazenella coriacea]